jgi:hypothetical protein
MLGCLLDEDVEDGLLHPELRVCFCMSSAGIILT